MKNRRILSLITAVNSFVIAAAYFFACVIFAVKFNDVLDFNSGVFENLFGVELLKAAGINAFVAVTGILLSFALGLYRVGVGYYYIKVSRGDDTFYMQREKGVIGCSVGSFIVLIAYKFLVGGLKGYAPSLLPFAIVVIALYAVGILLPMIELVLFEIKLKKKKIDIASDEKGSTVAEIKETLEGESDDVKSE